MHTSSITAPNRHRHSITAAVTVVAAICLGGAVHATDRTPPIDPPPWSQCAYRDLPAAVDLGSLLPTNFDPSADIKAVLLGSITVGTDCSIYDSPA